MEKATDVVVVGFGGAGTAAAIEAADAGVEVVVLEKMAKGGGATAMSGGVVYGAGTSVQRAAGIEDSADDMYKYYLATDNGMKDPDLVRILADKSAETIEWLMGLGVPFKPEDLSIGGSEREFTHITPAKPRSHWPGLPPVGRGGTRLFAVLDEAVRARKIDLMVKTTATELTTNSRGEVVGVRATSQGNKMVIRAKKAVILADGGFLYSPEMLKQFWSKAQYVTANKVDYSSHPGETGDGIRMAMALGAGLTGMGGNFSIPRELVPVGPQLAYRPKPRYPSIFVNRRGERFVNEDLSIGTISAALDTLDNKGLTAFQVFDDRVMQQLLENRDELGIPEFRLKQSVSAPTIAELATKLGIPATRLEDTISLWNRYAEMGEDPEFGKTGDTVRPLRTPPFWAFELLRRLDVFLGGLKTNTSGQVLHALHGRPIPRLYAAGQSTGGRFGFFYPSSGGALMDCFVFGRITARCAAAEISLDVHN